MGGRRLFIIGGIDLSANHGNYFERTWTELPESDLNVTEVAEFYDELLSALNKHAPTKNVYIRTNVPSYIAM